MLNTCGDWSIAYFDNSLFEYKIADHHHYKCYMEIEQRYLMVVLSKTLTMALPLPAAVREREGFSYLQGCIEIQRAYNDRLHTGRGTATSHITADGVLPALCTSDSQRGTGLIKSNITSSSCSVFSNSRTTIACGWR